MESGLERAMLGRMCHPVRGFLHGSAALASVIGGVALWMRTDGNVAHQITLAIFALSMVALYTVSSLYHSVPWREQWKRRMQRLDHSMIYVLIAGTYTPIAAIALSGRLRTATLVSVWAVATVGAIQKAFFPGVRDRFSIAAQTTLGWLGLLLVVPLARRLPGPALQLAVLGGLLYTLGMIFCVTKRPRLWPRVFSYHEVFHILVIAGSGAHYAMVFRYLSGDAPAAG
jgi:hemolysin III